MSLLDKLNPEQKKAVETLGGPLLLLAGAGSGKTRVLTHRIAYLIEKGVNPYNIIAITFTNKAAREMKERVEALVCENSGVWVSTFHSSCIRILRTEIVHLSYDKNFTIFDSDDSEKLIKICMKEIGINPTNFPPKMIMGEIGSAKDELIGPSSYEKENSTDFKLGQVAKVYKLYQKKLKENNALDFDDIIFKTVELFMIHPEILEKYQERFKYIMVDEYQDTNTAQYTLIRLLSGKYRNLCVVGDDDQSIYGWRGANIRNILDFEKDFPDAKTIKLEQNYRSTKNILESANMVIRNNSKRKDKNLWTEIEDGEKIKLFNAQSDLDEGVFVAGKIKEGVQNSKSYSDFAVLYRMNSQSRVIEDAFIRNNIPYRIFGGLRFYDRKEVKDILAYLKAIYNLSDEIALKRIINVPKRGIGDTTVEKLTQYANQREIHFFDALADVDMAFGASSKNKKILDFVSLMKSLKVQSEIMKVSDFMQLVLEKTSYISELAITTKDVEEAQERTENINQLYAKALEFEKNSETGMLAEFLEEVALVADIDGFTDEQETVVLMTLHSSKGLEFPTVFLVGVEEGIFPSSRAINSGVLSDLEEERRLCYVGITRAKSELFITYAKQRMQFGRIAANPPSSFLREIPPELIEDLGVVRKKAQYVDTLPINPKTTPLNLNVKSTRAEINKPAGFGGSSYGGASQEFEVNKNVPLNFKVGDKVRQLKYGFGEVKEIKPAGADYELTIEFTVAGSKKLMANLSKITKL